MIALWWALFVVTTLKGFDVPGFEWLPWWALILVIVSVATVRELYFFMFIEGFDYDEDRDGGIIRTASIRERSAEPA